MSKAREPATCYEFRTGSFNANQRDLIKDGNGFPCIPRLPRYSSENACRRVTHDYIRVLLIGERARPILASSCYSSRPSRIVSQFKLGNRYTPLTLQHFDNFH